MEAKTPILIKGRAIRISDNAMSPYLKPGDLIWVEEDSGKAPGFGQLVLTQNRISLRLSIHRFLPGGLMKADADEELRLDEVSELRILGIVTGRTTGAGTGDEKWVPFNHGLIVQMHRLQGVLSLMKEPKNPKLSRIASRSLKIVGAALRRLENRFIK